MSLPVVLGTSLALMLVSSTWTAAAEPKAKQSSLASDRHASASRSADKEDEERPRKGRAQKDEDSERKPTAKGRAQKDEDSERKSAAKGRAQKDEDSERKTAAKGRAQKEEDSERKAAAKGRAQKDEDSERKPAAKGRAQKDEDSERKPAAKGRAHKDEDSERKSAGRGRAQKDAASEPSSDSETVAALRQQLRDLRRQLGDVERLRAELAAAKASDETLPALKQQLRDLRKQVADMERLRSELAAVKAQVRGSTPTIWGGVPLTLPASLSAPPSGSPEIAALALRIPDVRDLDPRPLQPPVNPATASLPAVIREQSQAAPPPKSAVEEAKAYLVKTATPGYTMMRQGVWVAIDRLHPGFAVKLAEAVRRARAEGMTEAGVFSAYRPPAFGIGGFADKFDSLHSYGLATDITGIGSAGSVSAHRWHQIVLDVGLYLPYGPDHRVEFNHTQFIPAKVAPSELRATITADGPIDLRTMWLTSGVDAYVIEPSAIAAAGNPGNGASTEAVAGEPAAPPRPEE
jgi:hypothetical protein